MHEKKHRLQTHLKLCWQKLLYNQKWGSKVQKEFTDLRFTELRNESYQRFVNQSLQNHTEEQIIQNNEKNPKIL